ncbi:hypothetical protein [Natrinema sp. HArc-T2]|uniref:hypothetical protein n=1 Tax=Natrinema sp. HArc-T2 TaxID=3242701 RepID=UPI00359D7793
MDSFAAEVDTLNGAAATSHDREVSVTVVEKESNQSVDLRSVFETATRYGIVAFDGDAASNKAELHFKPADVVFDGDYDV